MTAIVDAERFELARQTRDARFDGRFFVGVLTTGIYCRPVCPVRIPRRENVQLYPTAAAAAEAGFRPCLRCRPETSPGTPAWLGSSWKVSRALQLIEQGLVDDGSIDGLATSLGVGTRQLSRLFKQHVGASPIAVAQTRRLHFAKQLLDESDLPIAEVCFAAGFGSVRRFNDVIRATYGRSPRELRSRRRGSVSTGQRIAVKLTYRPPFDWKAMLAFLASRAIPGIESVGSDCYRRTISIEGTVGEIEAVFSRDHPVLTLHIDFPDSTHLLRIVERVRNLFDLRADSTEIDNALKRDSLLRSMVRRFPGLRVPGCWDGLEIAIRAIVGQQVSVKGASTLMARLVGRVGQPYSSASDSGEQLYYSFPPPAVIAAADLDGLGITGVRVDAIKAVATAMACGELAVEATADSETFVESLCGIRGIGPWTAQYIALRALRDPDAFPHGDLVLQKAASGNEKPMTARQLLARAESWRPWRAYAVMLLWRDYQRRLSAAPAKS